MFISVVTDDFYRVLVITHCPECGSKLIRFEGEAAHYCPNETACPPQIKGKIEHFISRKAMNIDGLGPETVDMFYRLGLIKDTADLYQLKTDDIKNLERMGEKSAENIVNGIAASKEVPFERVLFALGIRFVGETVAKKIAKSFTDIEELENADLEKLKNIDEIGEKIAQSIITYFSNPVKETLYWGEVATGAYKMEGVTGRAGRSLEEMKASAFRMPCAETNEVFVIVASRSHLSAETEEYIEEKRKIYPHVELVSVGSSIKICKVCEGLADEYPRFAPTMEWDTAAGHAIAKASGAEIYQAGKEEPLKYNKPDLLNPWFVVKRN